MQELSLTKRQINYAINIINQKLYDNGFSLIKHHRDGSFSYPNELKLFLLKPKKYSTDNTYSDKERVTMIVFYLIANNKYVSLDHLVNFLQYSKTTVLQDIKSAEAEVKKYNLGIIYDRTKGYSLKGDEQDIFLMMTNLILQNRKLLTSDLASEVIGNPKVEKKAILIIIEFEQKFKMTFSDKYFEVLKTIIQLIYIRTTHKKDIGIQVDSFIERTAEYKYLKQLSLLKDTSDIGIKWIALEILSSNVYDKATSSFNYEELKINDFIDQMIISFEAKTLVKIQDKENFEQRLLNHLRPACYRVKYHIYGIDHIEVKNDDHKFLIAIIKELIKPLEKWIGQKFPDYEIQLLTYYFGYQLVNGLDNVSSLIPKYKAVVVCSNGIMMSSILIRNLKELFPELNFLFTLSAREFENSEQNFDVVFTTIPLKTKCRQYIVKLNIDYSEKISLRYRVLNELGIEKTDLKVQKLLKLISKYADVYDSESLKNDMEKLLISNHSTVSDNNQKDNLPNLLEFIHPEYIRVVNQKIIDWHTALTTALQPLKDAKKVKDSYYQELEKQIDTPYNYSFLGQYMAIPHSSPEKGVIDDGFSLLISKSPIFLPYGKQARIIAPIAVLNHERSKKAINQLAMLATNEIVIQRLINSKDSKEAYKILKKYIQERSK
nr:PTS sugar transporter subunit IIA [Lactobacillus colini]